MRKILLAMIVVAGCGGGGGPATFAPSAPGGAAINTLDAAQATKLCTEETTYEDNAFDPATEVEYACRVEGLKAVDLAATDSSTDAQLQAFCQAGYNACKSNPPDTTPTPAADIAVICANAMAAVTGCNATVSQYAACINEQANMLPKVLPACSQVTRAKLLEILLTTDGPACMTFNAACPDLAASQMSMSPLRAATK
jgi:hypothetical protein